VPREEVRGTYSRAIRTRAAACDRPPRAKAGARREGSGREVESSLVSPELGAGPENGGQEPGAPNNDGIRLVLSVLRSVDA
jgi:hypothetical protein